MTKVSICTAPYTWHPRFSNHDAHDVPLIKLPVSRCRQDMYLTSVVITGFHPVIANPNMPDSLLDADYIGHFLPLSAEALDGCGSCFRNDTKYKLPCLCTHCPHSRSFETLQMEVPPARHHMVSVWKLTVCMKARAGDQTKHHCILNRGSQVLKEPSEQVNLSRVVPGTTMHMCT